MSEQDQQLTFTGSPTTIGTDVFIQCVMPIFKQVFEQPNATPKSIVQFYGGFLSGFMGCVVSDFDKETVLDMLRGTADAIERTTFPGEGAAPH